MFINWAHHYVPKFAGIASILVNILFVYIVHNDRKVKLGNYRFLLLFFATYNMICTIGDVLVPMCIYNHKYAFSIFISDGLFEKRSEIGTILICIRCSLIPASYGILHSHFMYRYLVLSSSNLLNLFIPYGLVLSVAYCLSLMVIWFLAAYVFVNADDERRIYMVATLQDTFHVDVYDMNILIALFNKASRESVNKSWIGILIASILSFDSVLIYFIFGGMIVRKLANSGLNMSQKTKRLQKQLMKALVVQSTIPMLVSFLPCLFAWYLPVFNIDIGQWINQTASVALSFFPVLDPLALFYFIPAFQNRVKKMLGIPDKPELRKPISITLPAIPSPSD